MARWIIQELFDADWDTTGSVEAASAEQAVVAAGAWHPTVTRKRRAILWDQASQEEQDAATYEDNIRFEQWQAFGGRGTHIYATLHGGRPLTAEEFHRLNVHTKRSPLQFYSMAAACGILLFLLIWAIL